MSLNVILENIDYFSTTPNFLFYKKSRLSSNFTKFLSIIFYIYAIYIVSYGISIRRNKSSILIN
jgi:hypothetical protein